MRSPWSSNERHVRARRLHQRVHTADTDDHEQHDTISDVSTIGPLFLLNEAGAGAVIIMLIVKRRRLTGALGALGLCAGSVVSIAIASSSSAGLFGYTEPTLRAVVVIAVFAEILAIVTSPGSRLFARPAAA